MYNATLQRVDAPPATAAGGDLAAYVPGASINPRCVIDRPSFVIQRLIDQLKLDSTAVLFMKLVDMPSAPAVLVDNAQVLVQQDRMPAQLYHIDDARPVVANALSYIQCLLRVA